MNVNDTMTLWVENFGYDRSRVALAPDLGSARGCKHEQGAEATLLRSKSASHRFKRSLSVVKRSEKFGLGGASYA
jgi:hypothetical protein